MLKYLQKSSVAVHSAVAHDCLTSSGPAAQKQRKLNDKILNSALSLHFCISFCLCLLGVDQDLNSAKALYQQMQNEGLQVNELSLKRLALLYKNAGEAVPFEEPPVNITHLCF